MAWHTYNYLWIEPNMEPYLTFYLMHVDVWPDGLLAWLCSLCILQTITYIYIPERIRRILWKVGVVLLTIVILRWLICKHTYWITTSKLVSWKGNLCPIEFYLHFDGKFGGRNFGKLTVIHQICQCFALPKFPTVWYHVY